MKKIIKYLYHKYCIDDTNHIELSDDRINEYFKELEAISKDTKDPYLLMMSYRNYINKIYCEGYNEGSLSKYEYELLVKHPQSLN